MQMSSACPPPGLLADGRPGKHGAGVQTEISVINCSLAQAACHLAQKRSEKTPAIMAHQIMGWESPAVTGGRRCDTTFSEDSLPHR